MPVTEVFVSSLDKANLFANLLDTKLDTEVLSATHDINEIVQQNLLRFLVLLAKLDMIVYDVHAELCGGSYIKLPTGQI